MTAPGCSLVHCTSIMILLWALFVTLFSLFVYELLHLPKSKGLLILDGLLSAMALGLVTLVYSHIHFGHTGSAAPLLNTISPLPMLLCGTFLLLYGLLRWLYQIRYRTHLTEGPIREGIDNLPRGIGFFDHKGMPKLLNHQFRKLSFHLAGREIQSLAEWRDALYHPTEKATRLPSVHVTYRFTDGSVWQFQEADILMETGPFYTQILASDVTDLFETKTSLQQEYKRLQSMMKDVRELSHNLLSVTKTEELLAMKSKVHDEMGLSVLTMQRLYRGEIPNHTVSELILFWQNVLYDPFVLGDERQLTLNSLQKRAQTLGLTLTTNDAWPHPSLISPLVLIILREAMYNAIRHGKATTLHASLTDEPDAYTLIITNNGKTVTTPIEETGGLLALRHRIEATGGSMHITGHPIFTLACQLPKEVNLAVNFNR